MRRVQRQIWLPGEAGLSIAASSGAFASGNPLLQIAREALSNALKHSQASEVVVTVAQNDNQVKLTVQITAAACLKMPSAAITTA